MGCGERRPGLTSGSLIVSDRSTAITGFPSVNTAVFGVQHASPTAPCYLQVRASYSVLIGLDLPGQVLDIVKSLTTELRLSSLNNILTSVVEETYLLHEREDWRQDVSDQYGSITALPGVFQVMHLQHIHYLTHIYYLTHTLPDTRTLPDTYTT